VPRLGIHCAIYNPFIVVYINTRMIASFTVLVSYVEQTWLERKGFIMGIYNKYFADRFHDCMNGKCYCDRPCPRPTCMLNEECLNQAVEFSKLDNHTPACKRCNDKIASKLQCFCWFKVLD